MRTFPQWLHGELMNWAKWCWAGEMPGPTPQTTCSSFEKHWRPIEWESDPDDHGPAFIDATAATHLDVIWRRLPDRDRLIIRAAYPKRHLYESMHEACKEVGIKVHEWDDTLNRAAWLVVDRLNGGDTRAMMKAVREAK